MVQWIGRCEGQEGCLICLSHCSGYEETMTAVTRGLAGDESEWDGRESGLGSG